jgi:hypothetical protein
MADGALVLGVTGIVVSGVVGPAISAWFSQNSQTKAFNRAQAALRRESLRSVIDDAAVALASGATNIRILQAQPTSSEQYRNAIEWSLRIYPIGQRLQLWLRSDDPVVTSYGKVRDELTKISSASTPKDADALIREFEDERARFLEIAREKLRMPITSKEGAE